MTFLRLSYYPIIDSLHVYLNGIEQYEPTDWVYTGGLINVLGPMEAVSSDLLECRYAHLGVAVVPPPPVFSPPNVTTNTGSSPVTLTFSTTPAVGSAVLLYYQAFYSGAAGTVSGLGATWTRLASVAGGTGSADSRPSELWLGSGCNGTGSTVTVTGDDMTIVGIEVTTWLAAAGAQTNTAVTPDLSAGPLTSTGPGIAAYVLNAPSGLTTLPASGWVTASSVFKVQAVNLGDVVQADASSWAHAIVAVVH